MPTNYSSRITVIVVAVVLSFYLVFSPAIWHPSRLTDPSLTFIQKTNLNPGIDMVGGVRLIYEIQATPGQPIDGLSTQVMEALKRRVDPSGLRNLVWRPQGNTRLEIQMPLAPEAAQAPTFNKAYIAAKEHLETANIRTDSVINAVEHLTGDQRKQRLAELAFDSKTRADLFQQLTDTYDQLDHLKTNPDHLAPAILAAKEYPLTQTYAELKDRVEDTNLQAPELESILEQASSDNPEQKKIGQDKVDALKKKFADFPSRLKAMDDFEAAFRDYLTVRDAISGAEDLKRLLQGSGVLEFHILADMITVNQADLDVMYARLKPGGKGPLPQPGDTIKWMLVDKIEEFDKPGQKPETHEWNGKHYVPVLITPDASMNKASSEAWGLDHAGPTADERGARAVQFEFNNAGAKLFGDLTDRWYEFAKAKGEGLHSRLAIVLDDKVISAPNLNSAIEGGNGIISAGGAGGFNASDADYLIDTLNAGSLPAQLSNEPISEEQIGPTLGADNLAKGLLACGFGLIVVAVFLISYYYLAGIVATCAVLMNLLIVLGVMAALNATFTLPSIAGIVLTVGTAVDANVLIFERLREEQHKGLPLRMALRNAYAQAQSAIIDSNMTSIITSLCLYAFGSEEVKGFGLTLIIGIVASLFTALYVTKTVFAVLIDKFHVSHLGSLPLTLPKLDKALKPDWDWMGKAWMFYTFSSIMIVIGMVLFVAKVRAGKMMDIEFTTGTSLQFALKEPMKQEDVRALIDAESLKDPKSLPSPSVVAVGTDFRHYEIVCPNDNRTDVRAAVLDAMQDRLDVQQPSTFDHLDGDYAGARDTSILPIVDSSFAVDGYTPPAAAEHTGGVALVLRHIDPKLSVAEVRKRLDHERLSNSSQQLSALEYTVQGPGDSEQPTDFVVVIGWNSSVAYAADESKWTEDLAKPLWGMVKDAIHSKPAFEKETNFDPQVAGEMQRDAFLALTISIIGIMVYIWVRFGNLKYGTATVVALLHDTVFTLAAMGFAHYIYDYWKQNPLQIEPFRINLTVVAGVLTIMGYSMIDTIVVFDRIRENRGRYGHLDRRVINEAINQTLSRTLLTAGTNIITVAFMYFLGGAGIHGFTFVLLVGILVGTYSSVAIAAPMLLWGNPKEATGVIRTPMELQRTVG